MNDFLLYAGVKKEKLEKVLLTIDKLEKFGWDTVKKELNDKKIDNKTYTTYTKRKDYFW